MKQFDLQELIDIPVPRATDTYSPVPHKELIAEIYKTLKNNGLDIHSKSFRGNRAGTQLVGTFDLTETGPDQDIGYRLTFRNSYDKSMSVGFFAGAVVKVCSNGLMVSTGDSKVFVRKHTGAVMQEVRERISTSINALAPVMQKTMEHASAMKEIEVDRKAASELCGRMFVEQDIINSTQLNIIKREIHSPSYEVFKTSNLWSFYNHVTHALKNAHPTNFVDQHLMVHKFVETEYSL